MRPNHSRVSQDEYGFKRLLAFVDYRFSRRTRVYLELDTTRWKGNYLGVSGKSSSNGASLGITHSFE